MAGVTIIKAASMDLPPPSALICNTPSLKKGLDHKGRNSWVAHSHFQRGRSTGGGQTEELQVFVQLWGGGCSTVPCPGLQNSKKKAAGFLFLGYFLNLQYGRAVQNGNIKVNQTTGFRPPATHKLRLKRGKVNNKFMCSFFQYLTSHFSHRINDQLKHCIRVIENC